MNILFLCSHNACRSILAEAIFRHVAKALGVKAQIYSAGSTPRGQVHPLTLHYLTDWQINTVGLTSKSWDDLAAMTPDLVISVCDQAAGESCPVWFGKAVKAHWSLPDPTRAGLSEVEQQREFAALLQALQQRAEALFQMTSNADSAALAAIEKRFPVTKE
ncbi:arsenate reductase ArsC [Rheinheimera marina]|uniref:Arsenate reductase ArsC n=1 Tax=Rheinheimera marina TaxID=1774958 RepID=A0ABV9JPT1_9GAMM